MGKIVKRLLHNFFEAFKFYTASFIVFPTVLFLLILPPLLLFAPNDNNAGQVAGWAIIALSFLFFKIELLALSVKALFSKKEIIFFANHR